MVGECGGYVKSAMISERGVCSCGSDGVAQWEVEMDDI